ncbi:hypothetical protein FHS86_003517 [Roseimarinus sediminis]
MPSGMIHTVTCDFNRRKTADMEKNAVGMVHVNENEQSKASLTLICRNGQDQTIIKTIEHTRKRKLVAGCWSGLPTCFATAYSGTQKNHNRNNRTH